MIGWLYKIKRARLKLSSALALFLCLILFLPLSTGASSSRPIFIRDAEIEYYLRELGTPIFESASLPSQSINLLLIKDNQINAFVAGGMNIFLYTGLLQKTETPEELQAVIAHETGHIAGGHLLRGQEAMRNASAQAIIGMIAGVLAGVATGEGGIAAGTIGGAQTFAERTFLRFSRTQESSADAAAMRYLTQAGQNVKGLLGFMKKLQGQELLSQSRQSEYVRTHPLSKNRISSIKHFLENEQTNKDAKLPASFYKQHKRMKAKLLGYLQPHAALLRYTDKDPRINARYARAVALHQTNKTSRALALSDSLIKEEPENAFFLELKAQILFETGKIPQATDLYRKASTLLPDSALLHLAYGHALLEKGDEASLDIALQELTEAGRLEERSPRTWRFLAAAWGRKAQLTQSTKYQGLSLYALAEEAMSMGKHKAAGKTADRALTKLKKGSPYWLRAQDIKLTARNHTKE